MLEIMLEMLLEWVQIYLNHLFGSIIGAMVLGAAYVGLSEFSGIEINAVLLPLYIAAAGIIMSIIGTFFVRVKEGGDPHKALNTGEFLSAGLMIVVTYFFNTKFTS